MFYMTDTLIQVLTQIMNPPATIVSSLLDHLELFGWAKIEMSGEKDETARALLRQCGKVLDVKVDTFKNGPYNATMYGRVRTDIERYVIHDEKWTNTTYPKELLDG